MFLFCKLTLRVRMERLVTHKKISMMPNKDKILWVKLGMIGTKNAKKMHIIMNKREKTSNNFLIIL